MVKFADFLFIYEENWREFCAYSRRKYMHNRLYLFILYIYNITGWNYHRYYIFGVNAASIHIFEIL